MYRKKSIQAILLLLVISLLVVTACSNQPASANGADNVTAKQASINAELNGDLVSILQSDVDKYTNARFLVDTAARPLSFMAYKYDNQLYVRADICPPCRSESFTLTKGTLVCDTCGTVFAANTGDGIRGACVKFAKQSVTYEVKDGNIVMKGNDLVTAFQNTLYPKKS